MRRFLYCVVFSVVFALPMMLPAQTAPAAPVDTPSTGDDGINQALKKYLEAYQHKSWSELKEVWPSVDTGKDSGKHEADFADNSSGSTKMSFKPLETQKMTDRAIVHVQRIRQFMGTEHSTENVIGDNNRDNSFARGHPSDEHVKSVPQTRTDNLWVALQHEGDKWLITSVSDKKPKL